MFDHLSPYFKTSIEKEFFIWCMRKLDDYLDGSVSDSIAAFHRDHDDIPDEDIEWFSEIYFKHGALLAGIPRSVVDGKTKLSDHFSSDYIKFKTGGR